MALEIITTFRHGRIDGTMSSVHVQLKDEEHFWSIPVSVVKEDNPFGDSEWNDAYISYGSGGHQKEPTEAACVRAKGEALIRAAEVAEEMDRLWPSS